MGQAAQAGISVAGCCPETVEAAEQDVLSAAAWLRALHEQTRAGQGKLLKQGAVLEAYKHAVTTEASTRVR